MTEENESSLNTLPCLAIYFGNKRFNTIWKMPSVLLSDYLASDLAGQEDVWSDDVIMFTPFQDQQILLPELANCRAVETLFRMSGVEYQVEQRANAEFMSPTEKLPLVSCGNFILTDLEKIALFFKERGHSIGDHLVEEKDRSDMRSFLSPIKILLHAELYLCWADDVTYQSVTKKRYGSVFPFPLSFLLPWKKRREVLAELSVFQWKKKTLSEVTKEVHRCLQTFSDQLENKAWLFGAKPTEVDALLYGHLHAIRNCEYLDEQFSAILNDFPNLNSFRKRIDKEYFGKT